MSGAHRFHVNGRAVEVDTAPASRLTRVLREHLGLTGTKVGCDAGDCGACTVLLDGEQVCACLVPIGQVRGRSVTTVEGLAGNGGLSRLQRAFHEHGAAQCGICTPGMLMAASTLLGRPRPLSEPEVLDALGGVLCRCTGYRKIVRAVLAAVNDATGDAVDGATGDAVDGATGDAADGATGDAAGGATGGATGDAAGGAQDADVKRYVGRRLPSVDGPGKVTGRAVFGADGAPAGALRLRVVRSPHAHARFTLGDCAALRERHPGLARILTADDVPGVNGFGIYPEVKDQPVLAPGIVRYRGEAMFALVGDADTLARLTDDRLPVGWEPLPAVSDPRDALAAGALPVNPDRPDNVLARGRVHAGEVPPPGGGSPGRCSPGKGLPDAGSPGSALPGGGSSPGSRPPGDGSPDDDPQSEGPLNSDSPGGGSPGSGSPGDGSPDDDPQSEGPLDSDSPGGGSPGSGSPGSGPPSGGSSLSSDVPGGDSPGNGPPDDGGGSMGNGPPGDGSPGSGSPDDDPPSRASPAVSPSAGGLLVSGSPASVDLIEASGEFETPFIEHAYIEPEAGWARRIEGGRIEVTACTQTPYMDRDEVANVLGIAPGRVRIRPSACGGGFGGKLDQSVQPLVALAAWLLDKPVCCTYTRPESMAATTKRHPSRIRARAVAEPGGRLLGYEFDGDFDTGAYASWGPTVAGRVPVHCMGPYRVPNVRAEARAIFTHSPPAGAFRGFGVPQAAIAHETLIDELAVACGIDPLEFRRRNALRTGDRTATGQVLEASAGLVACLDALRPRWEALRREADAFNASASATDSAATSVSASAPAAVSPATSVSASTPAADSAATLDARIDTGCSLHHHRDRGRSAPPAPAPRRRHRVHVVRLRQHLDVEPLLDARDALPGRAGGVLQRGAGRRAGLIHGHAPDHGRSPGPAHRADRHGGLGQPTSPRTRGSPRPRARPSSPAARPSARAPTCARRPWPWSTPGRMRASGSTAGSCASPAGAVSNIPSHSGACRSSRARTSFSKAGACSIRPPPPSTRTARGSRTRPTASPRRSPAWRWIRSSARWRYAASSPPTTSAPP